MSDTEPPDEVNGYCGNTVKFVEHKEWGGHWIHVDSWCDAWECRESVKEATDE